MPAPFIVIFNTIQQRIAHSVPEIAHIALDAGQLNTRNRPPVSWPCVLIDFEDFIYTDLGSHIQSAIGTVVLRLGCAPLSGTGQHTPEVYRTQAITVYDLEARLNTALHTWPLPSEYMGALIRTAATSQRRTDGYHVRELRYRLSFDDYGTREQLQMAPATLVAPVIAL